jgi:hypothetical protein
MERSAWMQWIHQMLRGNIQSLSERPIIERLQLVVLALFIAAILDVVTAWLSWSNASLNAQYVELNRLIAQRMGYEAPASEQFSALAVFTTTFFVGGAGAALLWGSAGYVAIRGVLGRIVPLSGIFASAVVPLPLGSLVQLLTTVAHSLGMPIGFVPSLAAFLDPTTTDIRLYTIAAKLDLGALLHAGAMVCLAVPGCGWRDVAAGGLVAFVVRSIIVSGVILLIARMAALPSS